MEEGASTSKGELLDPRIGVELEQLNKSSENINRLERSLDEARSEFRQSLTETAQTLKHLSKKFGTSIEKARPYYKARFAAKEAQRDAQNAALQYERSCGQLVAAKEMVNLTEQGFFCKGQPFDPAWQEMLNHATIKVNDAENERLVSQLLHQSTTSLFNIADCRVTELHKQFKRSINKSRVYFEQKATFNVRLEDQKKHVVELDKAVTETKAQYAEALANLELISNSIHKHREDEQLRTKIGKRESGVGAESPSPPPLESSPDESDGGVIQKRSSDIEQSINSIGQTIKHHRTVAFAQSNTLADIAIPKQSTSDNQACLSDADSFDSVTPPPGSAAEYSMQLNAEIMKSLQRAKSIQLLKLPPKMCCSTSNFLDGASSGSGSNAGSFSVLDDEQVESLMKEMEDIEPFILWLEKSEKWTAAPLPAKLAYLQEYLQDRESTQHMDCSCSNDHLCLCKNRNPSLSKETERLSIQRAGENWAIINQDGMSRLNLMTESDNDDNDVFSAEATTTGAAAQGWFLGNTSKQRSSHEQPQPGCVPVYIDHKNMTKQLPCVCVLSDGKKILLTRKLTRTGSNSQMRRTSVSDPGLVVAESADTKLPAAALQAVLSGEALVITDLEEGNNEIILPSTSARRATTNSAESHSNNPSTSAAGAKQQ